MIPLSLGLRNFMSYGDTPVVVDFEGLHLACLVGGNGNGKSALLDALTWALWGRSRARREDDLVRQGATEMEVELCFRVGHARYRVLRKRSMKPGGGKASLELQAMGDGGYSSNTGSTIAETQARLNEILKIGYETFINSAFLLQGRADEFTVKPPAQRKEVLGEILGLELYDRLSERARERARTLAAKAQALKDDLAAKEADLAKRPLLLAELEELTRAHEGRLVVLHAAELALRDVQAERQGLQDKERQLEGAEATGAALRAEIATLQARRDAALGLVRNADALLADETTIAAQYAELRRVRSEVDEMGARAARAMELQPVVARIQQEIESEAAELRAIMKRAAGDEVAHERLAREQPALQRQAQELEAAAARIPVVEQERAALAAALQQRRGEATALELENKRLEAEMAPLRERLRLLNERGAACPVCNKPMSDEERGRALAQFKQEGLDRGKRRTDNQARLAALQHESAELERRDGALLAALADLSARAHESGRLQQRLQTAEAAVEAMREARTLQETVQATLERGDYAQEARRQLVAAEAALCEVGYDAARHTELRRRAESLAGAEARAAELATARERRLAALETIAAAEGDQTRRAAELALAEQSAGALRLALADLPAIEARLLTGQAAVDQSRREANEIDRQVAAQRALLHHLDEQEVSLRDKRAELAILEHEGGAYAELARLFGKKGVQAMLIDSALPELERQANAILTRMTDGAMQVRFSTQAQGSKGDLLETLDISIADASGTRPYEMFSGGEAFRANFAIRIALSRLLAERAGAQLQMLVIDEGFGTQDSEGRERLVEAINSIADDFEKIIVVTHIDELKDFFNVRIDVVKGLDGSRVTVTV